MRAPASPAMHEFHRPDIAYPAIQAAVDVHQSLGPRQNESTYERAFAARLQAAGLEVWTQVGLPLRYKQARLDCGFRVDAIVARSLVVEVKAVESLAPIHDAQVPTYLRLTEIKLGLLLNFDVAVMRQGIRRLILSSRPGPPTPDNTNCSPIVRGLTPLARQLWDAAGEVHQQLGPGLLPKAYETCLAYELHARRLAFRRAVQVPLDFPGAKGGETLHVPLLVDDRLPVVCLAVAELTDVHRARVRTMLRHGNWPHGLAINFNVLRLADGFRQVIR